MSSPHMRLRIRRRAALFGLAALVACSTTRDFTAPVETQYNLQTINGSVLPYQIDRASDGTVTYVMTDMTLYVAEFGTWRSAGHRTVTANDVASVQTLQDGGVYSSNGSSVTFANNNGGLTWTGTFSTNSYTLADLSTRIYVFVGK